LKPSAINQVEAIGTATLVPESAAITTTSSGSTKSGLR
jgi:hypothetical protein